MRLAIVTDIHGNLAALEAVAADIRRHEVDRVVNLGDSLSGPLLPLETARYLIATGWLCLAGNHERQILNDDPERGVSDAYARSQLSDRELDWLRTLPATARIATDVFLCHGTPYSDVGYFLETVEATGVRLATSSEIDARLGDEAASLIACGHTHVPRVVQTDRSQVVVNPGSVGLPAYDDLVPFPHVVENGSPHARYAVVDRSPTGWVVSLRSVPYDCASMARLAQRRGRPEWAHALLTGYMPK